MPKGLPALLIASAVQPTGDYSLTFAFSATSAEMALQHLRVILAKWLDLGLRGGFTHRRAAQGVIPAIELVEESASGDTYRCRLLADAIDGRAFELMRNMAGRLVLENIEVRSVVVEEGGSTGEYRSIPIPDDENETSRYPSLSPDLEFPIEFEDSEWGKSRRCRVEVRSGVRPGHVTGLAAWIEPWMVSLEAGAYSMPIGLPAEVDSIRGFISQFDETSIEISVMCYKASELGWNILMNCLGEYRRRTNVPLSRVTID
jgi:hypothetical protein